VQIARTLCSVAAGLYRTTGFAHLSLPVPKHCTRIIARDVRLNGVMEAYSPFLHPTKNLPGCWAAALIICSVLIGRAVRSWTC